MSIATVDVGAADYSLLRSQLSLVGHSLAADVGQACTSATVERTIDGASTLTLTVPDQRRTLLRSGVLDDYLWCVVDGLHYQLVNVSKATDVVTLQFEDAIVAALRRQKGSRTWEAASTKRGQIIRDMAAEVPVAVEVDPALSTTVQAEVNRSKAGQDPTDSWTLTGSVASDVGARRFSTGLALVAGGDDWLMTRYPVVRLAEPIRRPDGSVAIPSPLVNADFTIDYGQASNSMTLTVDTDRWATPVGQGVHLDDLGPASGTWLVQRAPKTLTRARMQVQLSRPATLLPEPAEDAGDFSFLPGATTVGSTAAGSDTTSAHAAQDVGSVATGGSADARELMLTYALRQQGKPYVWGASGPKGYDCSGLVQEATKAAGKALGKPAKSQWATVRAAGKGISVADALKTRGALLFRINSGDTDHVAISLGDGRTVEARGKAYGCGIFPGAAGRHWTNGGLWL